MTVGPRDSSRTPRYAGIATFALLPRLEEVERADIAVVGVPFDSGVSYRPGARFGPSHVRESSRLLRPYNPVQDVSPFAELQVADAGDIAVNPFSIDEAVGEIEARADDLRGRHPAAHDRRGPHHRAAAAAGRRQAGTARSPSCTSTPTSTPGTPTSVRRHARHAVPPSVGGGTDRPYRESAHRHPRPALRSRGPRRGRAPRLRDRRCHEVERLGVDEVVERIRARLGDRPVYVSVDIDVLDPAHAPGTGTPEAGGLTSRELLEFLRGLAATASSAPTSSRSHLPTTTPRSPGSPPRTWPTNYSRPWSRLPDPRLG